MCYMNCRMESYMLYAVVICIAYIIGIIWGLYLELYLSIVSFFLFICFVIVLSKNKLLKFNNERIFILILVCFYIGLINTKIRLYDFEYKYSPRDILWPRGSN